MYKTGIITDEISQDLNIAAKLAREDGLDALEIRSVNDKNPFELTLEDYKTISQTATDHGLEICAISSPLFKCDINNPDLVEKHIRGLYHCLEAAKILNCKLIRGFTFWRNDDDPDQLKRGAEIYQRIVPAVKEAGVQIVIESEASVEYLRLLRDSCHWQEK